MFRPPHCPWRRCAFYRDPVPNFYIRSGVYLAKCRPRPVQRYQCRGCHRKFSRQTFRSDYYDHKPHHNAPLFDYLSSGVGLRQSARKLKLSRSSTDQKARKIGRHLRRFNLHMQGPLPSGTTLQFDELETFEGRRNTRPLTLPILLDAKSRVVIWAESAPIRPRGKMTQRRKRAIQLEIERYGPRKDLSEVAIRRTLRRAVPLLKSGMLVNVQTDEKSNYPRLLREELGRRAHVELVHGQTNSKLRRDVENPLFPTNHTEAMMRDITGRLRRESWLASKRRRYLDIAVHVFIAYRNWVRRRVNDDARSSAEALGWIGRRLRSTEILGWRMTFGRRSLHPLGEGRRSIEEVQGA